VHLPLLATIKYGIDCELTERKRVRQESINAMHDLLVIEFTYLSSNRFDLSDYDNGRTNLVGFELGNVVKRTHLVLDVHNHRFAVCCTNHIR
jgi:hypothetical protein